MKKVLIITYYWPPSGGAGVQRWVKFTKYLREFGWEPVIYAPENPEYPSLDHSFEKDVPEGVQVIKRTIWEPYNIYRNLTGKRGEVIPAGFMTENKKAGWKERLSIAIRGNFLIPDPRRFWIGPSVKYLTKFLKENDINNIITTGPPHSMHMIGLGLKKAIPDLKWIADFRDPWTKIDFYQDLKLTFLADKIHHSMEKSVLRNADAVTVVTGGVLEDYALLNPKRIELIPNGYDAEDLPEVKPVPDKEFTISHIGSMNPARNPKTLWKALSVLADEIPEFRKDLRIQLIGKVDFQVNDSVAEAGLAENLVRVDYIPHKEAIYRQSSSQVLLLMINRSAASPTILPGKLFEYMASGRPILGIGPDKGNASDILRETESGYMVDFDDLDKMINVVRGYYLKYKIGNLATDTGAITKYSRKSLTGEMAALLNSL